MPREAGDIPRDILQRHPHCHTEMGRNKWKYGANSTAEMPCFAGLGGNNNDFVVGPSRRYEPTRNKDGAQEIPSS